ncbi:DUF2382 domain-containing protein [Oscillatoria sp. FACHB-1407]|uniref:DUF2382 domain-containing protein n=1 Tax=Oscillatoria sp. FACHB-1407 TaxID=2692847 RepID=UPI001689E9D3|nr:DUF2382 domain-containing protein [Oscillatoria sp. FACHB-1407]MBD2460932.1 DUF2382 domain-containing protein [Oscillatoria sp. FACHB-1407]
MTLLRLNELDPQHRRTVRGKDIRQFQIYSNHNQPIGNVSDALVDNAGQFHYLIADIHSPKASQHVLIPLRQTQVDLQGECIYLSGLDATQVAELPTYDVRNQHIVDSTSTQRFTQTHSDLPVTGSTVLVLEDSAPLETSMALESVTPLEAQVVKLVRPATTTVTSQTRTVGAPVAQTSDEPSMAAAVPSLEQMSVPKQAASDQSSLRTTSDVLDEQTIRLLEERLFVDRQKRKVGEVIVRKTIETQIVEIPIRRERLIVEQVSPEHKELASIDLSHGAMDDIELVKTLHSTGQTMPAMADGGLSTSGSKVMSSEFSSAEAAIEFLRAIATQPNSPKRVQIHLMSDA